MGHLQYHRTPHLDLRHALRIVLPALATASLSNVLLPCSNFVSLSRKSWNVCPPFCRSVHRLEVKMLMSSQKISTLLLPAFGQGIEFVTGGSVLISVLQNSVKFSCPAQRT
jgi:hypothetical protein